MREKYVTNISVRPSKVLHIEVMKNILCAVQDLLGEKEELLEETRPHPKLVRSDIVMLDIYAEQRDVTAPDPEVLDFSSPDIDKDAGFDPYDTGILHKK